MGRSKDLATGETRFVNTSGDSMTGALSVSGGANSAHLTLSGSANRGLKISTSNPDGQNDGTVILNAQDTEASGVYAKMSFQTAGTERMKIDNAGYVTNPYQPAFNAKRTSSQSISGTTTLVFNEIRSNQSNSYNSSNGIFTAPVAGQYIFTFKSLFYDFRTGEYLDLYSYVNSSIRNRYEQTGNDGGHTQIDYTEVVYLSANDTFKLVATDRNTGSFSMYAHENHFSGRLLG